MFIFISLRGMNEPIFGEISIGFMPSLRTSRTSQLVFVFGTSGLCFCQEGSGD